ncbi:MAG: tetratricopeptide repeat protein [Bacteroidales bacterium]|nr:tetratricopeptide repeat protein [Bacteroidales bacterium]
MRFPNKPVRSLIIVMSALVLIVFIFSRRYYAAKDAAVDPRIVPARKMYEKYNGFAAENQIDSIFSLMDTIESIYSHHAHYKDSYETGVLYNNRAAAWLTLGVFGSFTDSVEQEAHISKAEQAVNKSIRIYETWQEEFGDKSKEQIARNISENFKRGLASYSDESQALFLQTRVSEIMDAREEIDRRLSVSYTNLGIVYRYREQYDSAAICYQKALVLWDRNLTAENNLNILLGRPLRKRNFIERMFPPER